MVAAQLVFLVAAAQQVSITNLWQEAKVAMDHGQFADARRLLSHAVQINPKDPALWFHLGVSCSQLNQVDDAINAFEKTRSLAPGKADVDFNLGLLYWRRGDVGKAKEAYRAGLIIEPSEPSALQNYALLLIKTGESAKAIPSLIALKSVPDSSLAARISLIECYLEAKDEANVENETNELLKPGVAPPEQQTELAAILLQANEPIVAEKVLRSSLRLDPNQAKAHAALGVILMNRKQYEEAAKALEAAVHLQPNSEEFAMAFAESLLLWNHPTTMLLFLKSVQPAFGDSPEFKYKLALGYYGVQEFSNAVATLQDLLKKNPRRQDQIYYILGNSYFTMGNFEQSEASFRKAIELNPKEPDYYENLALLLRKRGSARIDDAIAQLRRAEELERSNPRVALQLGLCYETKGDLNYAAASIEKAITEESGLVPAHVALARIYFRLGRRADGLKEKAVIASLERKKQQQRLDPSHPAGEVIVDDRVQ